MCLYTIISKIHVYLNYCTCIHFLIIYVLSKVNMVIFKFGNYFSPTCVKTNFGLWVLPIIQLCLAFFSRSQVTLTCKKFIIVKLIIYSQSAFHRHSKLTIIVVLNADCFWTSWSFWTSCSATCDIGTQYRIKQYLGQGNDSGCERQEKQDTKTCLNNKTCIGAYIQNRIQTVHVGGLCR